MAKTDLSADELRELLHYNPETGMFSWTSTGPGRKTSVGTLHNKGYLRVRLNRAFFYAHRLAWLYVHGRWPHQTIDHINGIKTDNRLVNLREATPAIQQSNIRTNVWIEYGGKRKIVTEWAKDLGFSGAQVISYRLASGWPVEEALFNSQWQRPKKK
jgi:hypothetical protein